MEDANVLKQLIIEHPDALSDRKILKALLLDYFPTEKLKRNILLMAFDEGIVDEIRSLECIDNLIIHRYESVLEQGYGISSELSKEMIRLWADALGVQICNSNADNHEIKPGHSYHKVEHNSFQEHKCYTEGSYEYEKIKGGIRLARFLGDLDVKEIIVPSILNDQRVLEIGDLSFWDYEEVEKIIISEGIENIGKGSFAQCVKLKNIILPNSLKNICVDCPTAYSENLIIQKEKDESDKFREHFLDFNKGTFTKNDLEEIEIPKNVTYIGEKSFNGCKNLSQIILPDSLNSIEAGTFFDCCSLPYINLPKQLKYICSCAFANCKSLTEIELPKGLLEIGDLAFYNSSLKIVVIPDSVVLIGENAFGMNYQQEDLKNLKIFCNSESYASQYAYSHGMKCITI